VCVCVRERISFVCAYGGNSVTSTVCAPICACASQGEVHAPPTEPPSPPSPLRGTRAYKRTVACTHTHITYARMSNAQVVYDRQKALGSLRVYVRASVSYGEEDTCVSYEEEDTCASLYITSECMRLCVLWILGGAPFGGVWVVWGGFVWGREFIRNGTP